MRRRNFLGFACLLTLPGAACLSGGDWGLAEDQVEVACNGEMYVGRFSFVVPVPSDIAWEVLTDFERMPNFVPNLEASRIVSREEGRFFVAQRGKVDFGPLTFNFESERRIEANQREGLLISRAVSGSARHMQSEMRLLPEAGGTRLDYRLEMIPDRWLPSGLGISLMRRELAEQFSAMAREMMRRQQSRRVF